MTSTGSLQSLAARLAAVCVAWTLITPAAFAQRYLAHTYTETDGMPSSIVYGLSQSATGEMWMVTRNGLAIYDGASWRLRPLPDGVRASDEVRYRGDAEGNLWIAERSPSRLFRFNGESWDQTFGPNRPTGRVVTSMDVASVDGRTLVAMGTWQGWLEVFDGTRWELLELCSPSPIEAVTIYEGRILVATPRRVVTVRHSDTGLESVGELDTGGRRVIGMVVDRSTDVLWLVGRDWVARQADGVLTVLGEDLDLPRHANPSYPQLAPGPEGGLYFGHWTSVAHFHPGHGLERLDVDSGLVAAGATDILRDREGNVWISTLRGVSKLTSRRFTGYRREHGLFDDEVTAILERADGTMVLGHLGGLTLIDADFRSVRLSTTPGRERVLDMTEDADGHLWLAIESTGVGKIDPAGEIRWYLQETGPRSVEFDDQGLLWVASAHGVFTLGEDGAQKIALPDPDADRVVRRILRQDDALYFGTYQKGLFRYREGQWTRWLSARSPEENNVYAAFQDPDGVLWVGTASGLYRAEGQELVPAEAPVVDRPVYFLVRDQEGGLWIGTDNGVMLFRDRTLRHFTLADGLIGRETNRAAGVVDRNARVWIGTESGLSVYRSEWDLAPTVAPTVALLDLDVGGQRLPLNADLRLPHRANNLAFRFRAVSFLDESRIRVESRLEGFDRDWLAVDTPDRREIRYPRLPPGRYRFHLRAASAAGLWSETASSAQIVIRQPFWLSPWFFAIVVVALGSLAYIGHRYMVQWQYARTLEKDVQQKLGVIRASERRMRDMQAAELRKLSTTLSGIADGVIAIDLEGRIILINPAAEQMIGCAAEQVTGDLLAQVLPLKREIGRDEWDDLILRIAGSATPIELGDQTLVGAEGGEVLVEITGAAIGDVGAGAQGVVLALRDVTERQRIEGELAKTQRLEALGVLAGGIAHDFNNLLTVMLGNLSLLRMDPRVDAPHAETLESSEAAIRRARELTQQLLTFSRGGAPHRRPAAIDALVRESASLALSGSNIRCRLDLPHDLWPVQIDSGQIGQLLHNLLINAVQAMPEGGTVHITGVNHEQAPAPLRPGRAVEISITDTGCGIPDDDLTHIFDPFFTTKDRGSGLGLALAHSIVRRHEGSLSVESTVGQGTTFRIRLPASAVAPEPETDAGDERLPGRGRILVMDDEPAIRDVLGGLLTGLGYSVEFAPDGERALELYRERLGTERRFEAVILDLTIAGGMGGRETLQHLARIDPDVRAIVVSGYSNDPVLADPARYGFRARLGKPFGADDLARVLRETLSPEAPDPG